MTRVVIVSRTRMHSGVCVGALTRDEFRSVRLCGPRGEHGLPADAPFRIGDVWDLELRRPATVTPPHVEDAIVTNARRVATQSALGTYLRLNITPWVGGPEALFDGLVHFQGNGKGYIPGPVLPETSVGFWVPDEDLRLTDDGRYVYPAAIPRSIKYVGVDEPAASIPAGSLVRMSLSRWFPREDPKCWLQLSGWYPSRGTAPVRSPALTTLARSVVPMVWEAAEPTDPPNVEDGGDRGDLLDRALRRGLAIQEVGDLSEEVMRLKWRIAELRDSNREEDDLRAQAELIELHNRLRRTIARIDDLQRSLPDR